MKQRINLVPMAGAGQRFVDAGYTTPKPLVDVGGKPMVVRAVEGLPPADHWIFILREELAGHKPLTSLLRETCGSLEIITVDHLTEGQACTCLLARDQLPGDALLTIGACDNGMNYDPERYRKWSSDPDSDALIWTFRNNPAVMQNPKMYGWVVVNEEDIVQRVSCKIPISDTPMNDHAVIGTFSFKQAGQFLEAADRLIAENRRTNNEFYVDDTMTVCVENGLQVEPFEVDQYICWGTPQDVDLYHYWLAWFRDKEA